MGQCYSCNSDPQPKKLPISFDSKIVSRTIRRVLNVPKETIFLSDRQYNAYDHMDIVRFLNHDLSDKKQYLSESYDCDDFALVLAAAAKRWNGVVGSKNSGICFGIVWGDIRDTDDKPNPHAINFFIDITGDLWLVEPQTDKIFKPTVHSDFWMVIC